MSLLKLHRPINSGFLLNDEASVKLYNIMMGLSSGLHLSVFYYYILLNALIYNTCNVQNVCINMYY